MKPDIVFQIYNSAILLPWACLIFAPNARLTQWLARTYIFPFIYGLSYSIMLFTLLFTTKESLDFMSLDGVMRLFASKEGVLVGWIHYLAFDLVAGLWAFGDAQKRKVPHYLLAPCLAFTFIFGPFGFSLYWILRQRYLLPKEI